MVQNQVYLSPLCGTVANHVQESMSVGAHHVVHNSANILFQSPTTRHLVLGGNRYIPLCLGRLNTRNTPPPALVFLFFNPTRMSPSVKPVKPTVKFDTSVHVIKCRHGDMDAKVIHGCMFAGRVA